MKTLYLVIGSSGEYSDRLEWPVAVYETEEMARAAAEGAERCSRERCALFDAWYRDVYRPWHDKNPAPLMNVRRVEGIIVVEDYDIWLSRSDRPTEPELPPNPYDPEHGRGDEYTVEPVPLLAELPTDNSDEA